MSDKKTFYKFVIPSMIAFALSGVYAIVDGYFVGNAIGDAGLSAINIAYPIVALQQAIGTGIGMGGAVYYSIYKAEGRLKKAESFIAVGWWLLVAASFILTIAIFFSARRLLVLLGAESMILSYAEEYIKVIALGTLLQILGTGLVPFMRNYGGAFWAMAAMASGFITNIILDYLFVWVFEWGTEGAAGATIIGQGITMTIAIIYALLKKSFFLRTNPKEVGEVCRSVCRIGLAPFALTLTPNISLMLINRFSASYGGEKAIATYACISYIICIIYLILQGVGDGSQPLMSRCYGEKDTMKLKYFRKKAYFLAIFLAATGGILMFAFRAEVGVLFGTSDEVNAEVAAVIPIFLIALPFVAVNRITAAGFYATENSVLSYATAMAEPCFMLVFMLILPRFFGGQIMVWWSTVLSQISAAALAVIFALKTHREENVSGDSGSLSMFL